jgi:hypothetical protein
MLNILKYFNSNRISVIVVIPLLAFLYWIPALIDVSSLPLSREAGTPLGSLLLLFNREFRLLSSLLAFIALTVNAYLLVQLNTSLMFISSRSQLPGFFYLFLCLGFNELQQLIPAIPASTLIIIMVFRIFKTYKTEQLSFNFLDAGLLISLASLFYFPALVMYPVLLAGLVILRPFNWREWIYTLIGLLLPYGILFAVYYLADVSTENVFNGMLSNFRTQVHYHFTQGAWINLIYVLCLIVYNSAFMIGTIGNMKIHARKFFMYFLWFFLLALLIYLVLPGAGIEMIFLTNIPLSYLFSNYFVKCRQNWVNNLLFSCFLLLLLLQKFF